MYAVHSKLGIVFSSRIACVTAASSAGVFGCSGYSGCSGSTGGSGLSVTGTPGQA